MSPLTSPQHKHIPEVSAMMYQILLPTANACIQRQGQGATQADLCAENWVRQELGIKGGCGECESSGDRMNKGENK